MNPKKKEIHYGEEVRRKLEERGMSVAEFSRRICCTRCNVYDIFKRKDINTGLLEKISKELDFDFFYNEQSVK